MSELEVVFANWTALATATVIASGVVWGLVVRRLVPGATAWRTSLLGLSLGLCWLAPLAVQRLVETSTHESGLRSLGGILQFVLFMAATLATLLLQDHRRAR